MKQEENKHEEVLRLLEKYANYQMSEEELYQQKVSFIMGGLNHGSGITREQVERVLKEAELGRK